MNFCSQDGGPQARARRRLCSPHPTGQRAKCKVTVEWLGVGVWVRVHEDYQSQETIIYNIKIAKLD